MLIIQTILLLFLLYAVIKTIVRFRQHKLKFGWFLFWFALWILAGIVIALPETTSLLANLVGVTRGVDLIVYISLVLVFYLIFRILLKIEKIEQEITKVVREIAVRDKK